MQLVSPLETHLLPLDLVKCVSTKQREAVMKINHYALGKKFLTFGLIFLAAGLVTQGFTFSFESAMFNLGLIFSLSGLANILIYRVKGSKSPE